MHLLTLAPLVVLGVSIPWFLLAVLAWLLLAWYSRRVYFNPRREGDILSGLAWDFIRVYCRVYHQLRISGREHVPPAPVIGGRPVVVIANHTAGLDPVLIQAACPWFIRWMMAADMKGENLDWLWEFTGVILVDRSGKAEVTGIRAAMSTLRQGTAVGIFPEGKLRTTPTEINPFLPGVGLIVCRSNALILPAVIRGTPFCQSSWGSLAEPSRSSVEFKPMLDPCELGWKTGELAGNLEGLYRGWLATPANSAQ
jgi:1-acyl-sn-glycerol-3-phosphate acyltransferase